MADTCRHGYANKIGTCSDQLDGATVTELHEKDRCTITGRGTVIIVEQMANRKGLVGRTIDIDGASYRVRSTESCLIWGHDEGHCTCFGGTGLLVDSVSTEPTTT